MVALNETNRTEPIQMDGMKHHHVKGAKEDARMEENIEQALRVYRFESKEYRCCNPCPAEI